MSKRKMLNSDYTITKAIISPVFYLAYRANLKELGFYERREYKLQITVETANTQYSQRLMTYGTKQAGSAIADDDGPSKYLNI